MNLTLNALNKMKETCEKCSALESVFAAENEMELFADIQNLSASVDSTMRLLDELRDAVNYVKVNGYSDEWFDSINKELENQGLLRQIAEKNIGDARTAIDARKADIEALAEKIAIREEDLAAKREELESIVESTSKEEAGLVAKRDALAAALDERTLSAYNRIKDSVHNRLAVVTVCNESSCGGCFNTITPQRLIDIASGKMLVICEHCGRIIVSNQL